MIFKTNNFFIRPGTRTAWFSSCNKMLQLLAAPVPQIWLCSKGEESLFVLVGIITTLKNFCRNLLTLKKERLRVGGILFNEIVNSLTKFNLTVRWQIRRKRGRMCEGGWQYFQTSKSLVIKYWRIATSDVRYTLLRMPVFNYQTYCIVFVIHIYCIFNNILIIKC
jgi:hypothetical protein